MKAKRTTMRRRERNLRKSMRMPWPILRKLHKLNNLKIRQEHSNSSNNYNSKKLPKQQRLRNNNNNRKQQPMQQLANLSPPKHRMTEKLRSKQHRKLKLCKSSMNEEWPMPHNRKNRTDRNFFKKLKNRKRGRPRNKLNCSKSVRRS